MSPNFCVKAKVRRYRYYASRKTADGSIPVWRVPAGDLEELVMGGLRSFLSDRHSIFEAVDLQTADAATVHATFCACAMIVEEMQAQNVTQRQSTIARTIERVIVNEDCVEIVVSTESCSGARPIDTILKIPARVARIGKQMRLVVSQGTSRTRDPALVKLVVKAWQAREALERGEMNVAETASRLGYDRQYFGVLLRISYLAPAVVDLILAGRQPATLTRQKLARLSNLPRDWTAQKQTLAQVV